MKPLNLPKESQEALLKGASMFLIPIMPIDLKHNEMLNHILFKSGALHTNNAIRYSLYQIGDEVYLKHDKKVTWDFVLWSDIKAEYMTEEDSDLKATIKNVKVVRVQDIKAMEVANFMSPLNAFKADEKGKFIWFKDWYNKQYGNYENNPYVFLYKIERITNV